MSADRATRALLVPCAARAFRITTAMESVCLIVRAPLLHATMGVVTIRLGSSVARVMRDTRALRVANARKATRTTQGTACVGLRVAGREARSV